MFKVLQSHEEREPKAVLKNQSKRAQRRLQREEAQKQEAQRPNGVAASGVQPNDVPRSGTPFAGQGTTSAPNHAASLYQDLLFYEDVASPPYQHSAPAGAPYGVLKNSISAASKRNLLQYGSGHEPSSQLWSENQIDFPPGPGPGLPPGSNLLWSGSKALQLTERSNSLPGPCTPTHGSGAPGPSSCCLQPTPCSISAPGSNRGGRCLTPTSDYEEFPALPPPTQRPAPVRLAATSPGGSNLWRTPNQQGKQALQPGSNKGVKVLHRAHQWMELGSGCGRSLDQSPSGGGSSGRGGQYDDLDVDPSLLCDLLDHSMLLRPDPLGEERLEGPAPEELAVTRQLVRAQCKKDAGEGPARGVTQEDMIVMMACTHRRQRGRSRKKNGSCSQQGAARASGGSSLGGADSTSGGGQGTSAGSSEGHGGDGDSAFTGDGDGDCDWEEADADDGEERMYYRSFDDKCSWRRTVETMLKNDWVRVKTAAGKHDKYRRHLPNGLVQTQTVCCTPSDALRGIHNLHADLASKDKVANQALEAERMRLRVAAAAAAAAAAASAAQN